MIRDQEQPHAIQEEYWLLGRILIDNGIFEHIRFLDAAHFYSQGHADIYRLMRVLRDRGDQITPFNLPMADEQKEQFRNSGGLTQYLGAAAATCSACVDPVTAAEHLVSLARRRELILACVRAAEDIADTSQAKAPEEHALDTIGRLEKTISDGYESKIVDGMEVAQSILDSLRDARNPTPTGLSKLDEAMGGGMFPGRSYGIAARKKMGKTMIAGTISYNLSLADVKHLFVCGEMSPEEIHQRTLARAMGIFPSAFRTDFHQRPGFDRQLVEAAQSAKNVRYFNAPGLTLDKLKRVCAMGVMRHKVKGIIIDYWQLVGGKPKGMNSSEHLDEVAQWIADFGRKYGVWMFVLAQINQEGNTRGGEGIRLAFDQVYELKAPGDDPSRSERWIEMRDTRYTKWLNVGSDTSPYLTINEKGPFFEES